MYRLSGMTISGGATMVSGVSYNAANQLLTINYGTTETRTYNALNQLVTLSANNGASTVENLTYNYPSGANNGKLTSMYNAVSGETITYAYDSLNRLSTAADCTLSSGCTQGQLQWAELYGFDSFGNLLSKTITAGSGAPNLSQAVYPYNNQIVGGSYDANGNATYTNNGAVAYTLGYDAENRLNYTYANGQGTSYAYDAQNRRNWIWAGTEDVAGNQINYTVNAYTPGGQKLGAYTLAPSYNQTLSKWVMSVTATSNDTYFGSRRLAVMDQLGSTSTFYPWGEAKGTNPQNTWNFATYWQDSTTGLDYANNRYYSNIGGRFMTPDPYMAGGAQKGSVNNPADPGSWNRYAYTRGDPVNRADPAGTCDLQISFSGDDAFYTNCDPSLGPDFNPAAYAQCMATPGCYTPLPGGGNFQAPGTANPLGAAGAGASAFVLEQAVDLAMQVLSLPSCSKLFAPLSGPSPAVLLLDLYAGNTSYGNITFGPIDEETPGVTTYAATTSGLPPMGSTTGQALITLQTQGSGASLWLFSGAPSYVNAAATIIHELGHAANIILGAGSSSIASDVDNTAQSMANQNTVLQDCFGSSPF